MQLHAVEAGGLGAPGGRGENAGKHLRQIANVRLVDVRHTLAKPELHRLDLARAQDLAEPFVRLSEECRADGGVRIGDSPRRRWHDFASFDTFKI